jgi:PhnB protein
MSDHDRFDELEAALAAVFAGRDVPEDVGADSRDLARLAGYLLGMPREEFRTRLKTELVRPRPPAIREGFHTVTPYIVVSRAEALIDFAREAFGATELMRSGGSAGGFHAEVRIGDSNLMMGGFPGMPFPETRATLHLYVPDADATYRQALAAGATSLYEPVDQPYGDREAGVTDPFGNRWFIATHREGPRHVPEGMRSVTPYFLARDAAGLMESVKRAFAAEELYRVASPDGVVRHATMRIGDSVIELGEARGEPSTPAMLYLYVDDADAWYARAVSGGAVPVAAPALAPYGDRVGHVKDSHGNDWYLATHQA